MRNYSKSLTLKFVNFYLRRRYEMDGVVLNIDYTNLNKKLFFYFCPIINNEFVLE